MASHRIRRGRLRLTFENGFIERPTFRAIASAIAEASSPEAVCLFNWWEGGGHWWAEINVYRGTLEVVHDLIPYRDDFHFASPTLWWAEDRSWFVCTHIEADSTYVGGSTTLVERVISEAALEAARVEPDFEFPGRMFDEFDYTDLP